MAFNDFSMDNLWLPFTPNRSFAKQPRVLVAADGMHFTTHDGRQVIDGISSLWCVGAGHNRWITPPPLTLRTTRPTKRLK
jgi:beta-alanine--pyruvate transaminase